MPHPNVVARRLDEETVLVHLDTSRIFTLNTTGSRIWDLLNGDEEVRDLDSLERALRAQYHVDDDVLHDDVAALLRQFQEEQLVVHEGNAS